MTMGPSPEPTRDQKIPETCPNSGPPDQRVHVHTDQDSPVVRISGLSVVAVANVTLGPRDQSRHSLNTLG